jgi:hypothetical protein
VSGAVAKGNLDERNLRTARVLVLIAAGLAVAALLVGIRW